MSDEPTCYSARTVQDNKNFSHCFNPFQCIQLTHSGLNPMDTCAAGTLVLAAQGTYWQYKSWGASLLQMVRGTAGKVIAAPGGSTNANMAGKGRFGVQIRRGEEE